MHFTRSLILGAGLLLAMEASAQDAANRTTLLPSMTVAGAVVPGENKIVGAYGQPEWSARRPFPGVSVYVVPAGEAEVELGYLVQSFPTERGRGEFTQEIELGLGHRFQVAMENSVRNYREPATPTQAWREDSFTGSLRYAVADWGKVPFNPALSAGWRHNQRTRDAWQLGVVVGDEITPRWHWAANLGTEHPLGSAGRREVTGDMAITYSVTNETLNLGLQTGWRSRHGGGEPGTSYAVGGPCFQYRPWDEFHFNAACMWSDHVSGATTREIQISIGFEFGEGADDHDGEAKGGGKFDR